MSYFSYSKTFLFHFQKKSMVINLALLCLQCLLLHRVSIYVYGLESHPLVLPFFVHPDNKSLLLPHKAQKALSNLSGFSTPPHPRLLGTLSLFTWYYLLLSKLLRTLSIPFHLFLSYHLTGPQTNGCPLHLVQTGRSKPLVR